MDDFESLGSLSLRVTNAERVVVGVLADSPEMVALALGCNDDYLLLECPPSKARQIAASLLNKADSVEGIA